MTELLQSTDIEHLKKAACYLNEGDVVAFPTETVYGLGASICLEKAIHNIFQVKGRASDNPLIVHISSLLQVETLALDIPASFYVLAEHFFPGPLTVVLKKQPTVSSLISGGQPTVALRMPKHFVAQKLINFVGHPLVAPSANLSGKPSSTTASHVLNDFKGKIQAIIDGGPCEVGLESTVISLIDEEPLLLRPGSITKEQLEAVLKKPVKIYQKKEGDAVLSPGLKYRHYAPEAPITIFDTFHQAKSYCHAHPHPHRLILSNEKTALSLFEHPLTNQSLYASLRFADEVEIAEIVVILDPTTKSNQALMNRLQRAAAK